MTETHATIAHRVPNFPPGRYGRRRAVRRRRPWVVGLALVAVLGVMALVAARLYDQYGDPAYDAQVITYTDITDNQLVVDFTVTVPKGGSAICVVRARSHDGAEVAREEVPVTAAPGQRHVTVRHRLTTSARPWIGDVVQCRPPGTAPAGTAR